MIRLKPFLATAVHVLRSEGVVNELLIEANSENEEVTLFLSETAPIKGLTLIGPTGKKYRFKNSDLVAIANTGM
jgi:hypothetical protein